MSIKFTNNEIKKLGGAIVFIPDGCEYLKGKVLDVQDCEVYCYKDSLENQITKTVYGIMLGRGKLSIKGDSVVASGARLYCSGNLEVYAKALAAYCRKICGREEIEF
jgi:hypothetical protein